MNFFKWTQGHARSLLFLLVVLALGGLASSLQVPVSLFPQVDFPRVALSLDSGDRPAERMVAEVTRPVEESLRAMPGVRGIRSTSSRGTADIFVDFDWGQDMTSAILQAQSQVNKVLPTLPAGTTFEVERRDPTVFPVIAYSLTSKTRSLAELHDLAQYELRPVLSTVTGVARVDVQGGAIEEYQVIADPGKLRSFGLTLTDVSDALSAANVLTAVGRLEDHYKLYLAISDSRFQSIEQIESTVLRAGANGVVRLTDVAYVRKDVAPAYTRVTADGQDAVLFQVFQQPGGNTVQIAGDIKKALETFKQRFAEQDVKVANWYDQSDLIVSSAGSVRDAVIVGVALAALILLLFLRNWKVTLIAAMVVPSVLASTVLLLWVLGMSFNIMTLGGMAAAVGLIVDDAIVMVEHIIRRVRGAGGDFRERVSAAAAEFTRPLVGSSASTIVIFAPLAFLNGVTGAFFKALSLTMATSLIISFFTAWLAVPVLAARLLRQKDADQKEGGAISNLVNRGYAGLMRGLLRAPWLVLLLLLAAGFFGYRTLMNLPANLMPAMDEGGFILDYNAPAGTSVAETDRLLRQVETILRATPEVETYSRRTGLQLGGALSEANQGDFFVRLKPLPRRDIEEIMKDVRERVEGTVPGLKIETAQLMEDLIGDLTAVPQPIEVKVFSEDPQALEASAKIVADTIKDVKGIVEIKGIVRAGDALNIQIDRAKAALEGMAVDDITKQMTDALSGNVTTQIQQGPKLVGIRVWTPRSTRATIENVEEIPIHSPKGHTFPLKRVATLSPLSGQPEITRENLRQMVAITARIEDRDVGSTAQEVKAALSKPGVLPAGVTWSLGGLYEQQTIAYRGMAIVFAAAVVLVFVLLLFLYESFRVVIAMLITTAMALAGVVFGLALTGTALNITDQMGMTMIVGIVTEVAIFYYSELHDLPLDIEPRERLILAGVNRMRPIAMTTLAAILALLPLALGVGQGSAMQRPLAIAIIAGLMVQLPLVLIVLPSLLAMLRVARRH